MAALLLRALDKLSSLFTVPTTSSRPNTKMTGFSFFACMHPFSVAGALARPFESKNRNCAQKVLC